MNTLFRNTYSVTLRTLVIAAALALCPFAAPRTALAADVLLVKDADIKPYSDVIQGFKKTCGCSVREINLDDPAAIEQAIKARPAAVVAIGTQTFRKIKAIRNVPIIYVMVMPSEAAEASGGNVSGISMDIDPEIYLDTMTRLFPHAARIGVLFDPEHTGPFVQEAIAAARARGVTLVVKKVRDPQQTPALLEELRGKVDVLWMLPDATLVNSDTINYFMLFSFQNNIPIFTFSEKIVAMGAVAALKIDPADMGAQAGEMAGTLMQGGKVAPRVYARTPHLIVNMKVGAKIGTRLNGEIVRNAEKVE
jgi:putative ABC transport system substrate-binding protein